MARGSTIAAVVIGGVGAGLGAAMGLLGVLGTFLLAVMTDDRFFPFVLTEPPAGFYTFLLIYGVMELGIGASCLLGIVGARFAIANRCRIVAIMMLVGAAGVLLAVATFVVVLPLQAPDAPAVWPPFSDTAPGAVPYALWHFPVPLLLTGAVLAFLTHRRQYQDD